jgi:ligand-binding sensor domain-containing protein
MKPDFVRQTLLIGVLGALLCGAAPAQRHDRTIFQFQHTGWTVKEGAPSPVIDLAQTPDGYLWIATPQGLYRFDGIDFELYQPSSGQRFRSDYINSLRATPDGGLWIGLNYGGADFLKDGRITSYGESEGLPPGSVNAFALDMDGTVWAATNGGLARFDGSGWQRIGLDRGYSGKLAEALFVDREGTLWVASEDALFFEQGKRDFRKCADHLGRTNSISESRDGALWLAELPNRDGTAPAIRSTPLLPPEGSRALPRVFEIDDVQSSFIDHSGSLWIVSNNGVFRVPYPERLEKSGISRIDDRTAQHFSKKDGLTTDLILCTSSIEDPEGDVWIGTARGLDRFRESKVVPITTDPESPLLVAGDQGDVWTQLETSSHEFWVHLRGMKAIGSQPIKARPTAAYRDANGVIWLGGPGGLWRLAMSRLVRYPLPDGIAPTNTLFEVQAITGDRAGRLWVSIVRHGVYRWANGVWTHFGNLQDLPRNTAVSLLTDSTGRIWFGYMGSQIAVLDGDHVKTFTARDGLEVVNIQTIYEHAGHFWIGGEHGLAMLKDNHFQSLTPDGNSPFTGISGIAETATGDLWLNATPGIFRIPAAEIKRAIKQPSYHVNYELFDILDGLEGKAVQLRPLPTLVEGTDGRLWFSTFGSVVQIDPNHVLQNATAPSVFIRSVDSGGVVHSGPGAIALPPRSTNVHIEYTAPNLSVPERVRYRYRLEGSNREWQNAGTRREAFYTNLGPGHYRFTVIACNEDGVWNSMGAAIDFTIAPAWFQTIWFFGLCIAVILLLVFVIYRIRVRQIANAIGARFDERLDERTRIARDLHDTFLQTIQGSRLVADSALKRSADPLRMREALEQLSVWLARATTEGRVALNSLRTTTTETNDLAESFRRAIEEGRTERSMETSFSVVGEIKDMHPIVRDEVYRVGYEAIRNACIHSQASKLRVTLTYGGELIVDVADNGLGIDPSIADRGKEGHFGLKGMRERAARIAAKLTVTSSPESGTQVKLAVPGKIVFRKTTSDNH